MAELRITVPGRAKTKERPRQGRGGRFFTPRKTREYEELVAWHCRASKIRLGPAVVGVRLELWSTRPLRGDLDNYAKAILDGLIKGGVLDDDRQISSLLIQQMAALDESERVEIILSPTIHPASALPSAM